MQLNRWEDLWKMLATGVVGPEDLAIRPVEDFGSEELKKKINLLDRAWSGETTNCEPIEA